jgi:two-component system chemotaxis sensor kinase CheA
VLVRRWSAELSLKPLRDMLGPIRGLVERLGERLGKAVTLEVHGDGLAVDAVAFGPIVGVLPHMLRNAIDHGIESPGARGSKPGAGRLVVSAKDAGAEWTLEVEDDGAGIDGAAVAARAVALGLLTSDAAARLSAAERLDLVFLDQLSTSEEVTEVSGRGVGMSAVRSAARHSGGYVTVESRLGLGTRFTVHLPKLQALRVDAGSMPIAARGALPRPATT